MDFGYDVEKEEPRGEKRDASGALVNQGSALTERHRTCLKRGKKGAEESSWRPKKMHRVSAKHWLIHSDNQIRVSSYWNGWQSFQRSDSAQWSDEAWASWPHVTASLDQGSDGLSASFSLEYYWHVNITRMADFSHGGHKDLQIALGAACLKDWNHVAMISANVPHGPDKDDLRFHQLRSAMATAYETRDETTPVFAEFAADIHATMKKHGHAFPNEQSLEKEAWDLCKSTDRFTRNNYRLNFNRFQGGIKTYEEESLPRWPQDLWERMFLCLELDMLHGAAVRRLVLRPGAADHFGEGGGSTASDRITIEDRSLRSCLQNALVVSVMFLQDRTNKQRMVIVVGVAQHLRKWHGHQSSFLRSCANALQWMEEQVGKNKFSSMPTPSSLRRQALPSWTMPCSVFHPPL